MTRHQEQVIAAQSIAADLRTRIKVVQVLLGALDQLNYAGNTVIVVEHDMHVAGSSD